MNKKFPIHFIGLIIILSSWWYLNKSQTIPPEEGVIDVWSTWGEKPEHLQTFLDRYSRSSGIPLKITTQVRSNDLLASLTATNAPDLVILSSVDPLESYSEQGFVEPLDEWFQIVDIDLEDFFRNPLEQCRSMDGAYLCLPIGGDVDALFWNKDLFAAAGLDPEQAPQTMEELLEYTKKLTLRDDEGALRQAGFIPNLPHSQFEIYARMFGGTLSNDIEDKLSAGSQSGMEAHNWQQQFADLYTGNELDDFVAAFTPYMTSSHPLFDGKRMSCQQCHRPTSVQKSNSPDAGFYEGRVAMMIDGQWQVSLSTRSGGLSTLNYGVAPVPQSKAHPDMANTTVIRGPVVFIPSAAIDKDSAARLLAWMTSPGILAEAADAYAMLSVSQTSAQDARFQENRALKLFMDLMDGPNTKNTATR